MISQALGSDLAGVLTALALLVTAVTSLLSVIIGFRNSRQIESVRHATNGLKDELVSSTRVAAKAEGYIDGRREGRQAQKEDEAERAQRP